MADVRGYEIWVAELGRPVESRTAECEAGLWGFSSLRRNYPTAELRRDCCDNTGFLGSCPGYDVMRSGFAAGVRLNCTGIATFSGFFGQ